MKERNISLMRAKIPGPQNNVYSESFEEVKLAESLASGYLEAYLLQDQESWNTQVINPVVDSLSPLGAAEKVLGHRPFLFGISLTYQWQLPYAQEVARLIKEQRPDAHIVVGGMFATSAWQKILEYPYFDSVCRFEGEQTLLELSNKLAYGQDWRGIPGLAYRDDYGAPLFPKLRQRIKDLGSLPFPTRSYLPQILESGGVIQIESSRSCNARCTFCDVRMTGWVGRPVKHFVDEIELLSKKFPDQQFWIVDNIFIGFGKGRFQRAAEFADEIIRRNLKIKFTFQDRAENMQRDVLAKLKKAGLTKVYLGVESFAQSALDRWQKGSLVEINKRSLLILKDLGIFTQMGFLVFDDQTTMAEIKESLAGLREVQNNNGYLHIHNFNELIPYPGTYLEKEYEKKYGQFPDPNSAHIWSFAEAKVGVYRDIVWKYLMRVWPVTEIIFHNFDNSEVYRDLLNFLPTKNRLFIDFFETMHKAVAACFIGSGSSLATCKNKKRINKGN